MANEALIITLDADRRAELDRIAEAQGRDRGTVINEAIANWLDLQSWQTREIEAGLVEAEAGDFASKTEIDAAYRTG